MSYTLQRIPFCLAFYVSSVCQYNCIAYVRWFRMFCQDLLVSGGLTETFSSASLCLNFGDSSLRVFTMSLSALPSSSFSICASPSHCPTVSGCLSLSLSVCVPSPSLPFTARSILYFSPHPFVSFLLFLLVSRSHYSPYLPVGLSVKGRRYFYFYVYIVKIIIIPLYIVVVYTYYTTTYSGIISFII